MTDSVNWAGRTFGELSPAEQKIAMRQAAHQLENELNELPDLSSIEAQEPDPAQIDEWEAQDAEKHLEAIKAEEAEYAEQERLSVDPYNELPEDGGIEPPGEGRRLDIGDLS